MPELICNRCTVLKNCLSQSALNIYSNRKLELISHKYNNRLPELICNKCTNRLPEPICEKYTSRMPELICNKYMYSSIRIPELIFEIYKQIAIANL